MTYCLAPSHRTVADASPGAWAFSSGSRGPFSRKNFMQVTVFSENGVGDPEIERPKTNETQG